MPRIVGHGLSKTLPASVGGQNKYAVHLMKHTNFGPGFAVSCQCCSRDMHWGTRAKKGHTDHTRTLVLPRTTVGDYTGDIVTSRATKLEKAAQCWRSIAVSRGTGAAMTVRHNGDTMTERWAAEVRNYNLRGCVTMHVAAHNILVQPGRTIRETGPLVQPDQQKESGFADLVGRGGQLLEPSYLAGQRHHGPQSK